MRFFGASVYLELATEQQLKNYIELLGKYNINFILLDLDFNQKNQKEIWQKLSIITSLAKSYHIDVYGNISFLFLKELNLLNKKAKELINFFKTKGLNGIRCDQGIDLETQAKITYNNCGFKLIINGSLNLLQIERLVLGYGINKDNIISCYNFYPQEYTGASVDFYLINQYESHVNNILFAGFISLQGKDYHGKNGYKSLPSLEIHRNWSFLTQIQHLIALNTDIIIIANQFVKEQELIALTNVEQEKVTLEIDLISGVSEIEKTILFDKNIHFVRPDLSEYVIRSSMSINKELLITPRKVINQYLEVGDVVILNQKSFDYCGELQIITKRIKNDDYRNLVAKIKEPYVNYFLSELKATRSFRFILKEV